jgi:hypothetical protein
LTGPPDTGPGGSKRWLDGTHSNPTRSDSYFEWIRPRVTGVVCRARHVVVAVDFMTVAAAGFRVLYVFVVLSPARRGILHVNVTANPTSRPAALQLVEAFPCGGASAWLQRDRDGIYGDVFKKQAKAMGIEELVRAARSP